MRLETVTRIKGLLAVGLPLVWILGVKFGAFWLFPFGPFFSLPCYLLVSLLFGIGWVRGRSQIRRTEHAARVLARG